MICEICKLVITLGEMDKLVLDRESGKVRHLECIEEEKRKAPKDEKQKDK